MKKSRKHFLLAAICFLLGFHSCISEIYNYIPEPNRKFILYTPDDTVIFSFKDTLVMGAVTEKQFFLDYGELFSSEYTENGNLIISDIAGKNEIINIEISPSFVTYRLFPDSSIFPDAFVVSHLNFSAGMKDGLLYTDYEWKTPAVKVNDKTYALYSQIDSTKNAILYVSSEKGLEQIFVPGYDTLKIYRKGKLK